MQPLWKTVWRLLKKLKIELPYDPAIPLLGIYLETMKTPSWKDTCIPMFTAALFTIAKTWKQPKCPSTDNWIKKMSPMSLQLLAWRHLPDCCTEKVNPSKTPSSEWVELREIRIMGVQNIGEICKAKCQRGGSYIMKELQKPTGGHSWVFGWIIAAHA